MKKLKVFFVVPLIVFSVIQLGAQEQAAAKDSGNTPIETFDTEPQSTAEILSNPQKTFKDFEWELSKDGTEVYIIKYTGVDKKIIVPEKINNLPVTAISGFANNKNIVSVVLPDSVKELRKSDESLYVGAFTNCTSLKTISLSKNLKKIDPYCFSFCTSLENIKLGDDIEFIGNHAFADCTSLKTIALPKNLKKIPWAAFIRCRSLESVQLPEALNEISYISFSGCTSLQTITLPNSLLHIGPQAFENCAGLKDVTLSNENMNFHDYGKGIFTGCISMSEKSRTEISENGYTGSFD
ncbi:MAG: hypothetical protein Ta2F_08170 [Termitinemataceae bacterium]|nr:MAG: hypothetical protein Ta2F_08170 [Termitinemataceae bacterium]